MNSAEDHKHSFMLKIKQVSLENLKTKLIFSGKIGGKNEDLNNYLQLIANGEKLG